MAISETGPVPVWDALGFQHKENYMKLVESVAAAHRCSVPLVAIETPDPAATIEAIKIGVSPDCPKAAWDLINGWRSLNEAGGYAISAMGGTHENNILAAIKGAANAPPESILFIKMANRFFGMPAVVQAIWNLRDVFKSNGRMLVLIGASMSELPLELTRDVVLLDEPLPTDQQLEAIVRDLVSTAEVTAPDAVVAEAVDATRGLSAFEAEQVVAMSITKQGVEISECWERKRKTIEKAKGLSVFRGGDRFSDLAGLDQVKKYLNGLMNGPMKPRAIVWLDEIEKSGLAHTGDLSGVNSDQLGTVLTYMEDRKVFGMMLVGVPGCGKSHLCKAMGSEYGRLVIRMDMGEMQGSLVGESQQNLRNALKTVDAIAGDNALFVATSNSIEGLDSALKSRFTDTFFFDLPTQEQLSQAWDIHTAVFGLSGDRPSDEGWSGRNVQRCCQKAYSLGLPLTEAASFVIPEAIRSKDEINKLRMQAAGKYLSSEYPGAYRGMTEQTVSNGRRKVGV